MTDATRKKIVLVRAAIERIKDGGMELARLAHDASSSSGDQTKAIGRLLSREEEFAWQWQNVEAILDELAPEVTHESW